MQDCLRYISSYAACSCNNTFMVLFDERFVNAGVFAIHAFYVSKGSKTDQVLISGFIFCQQYLVESFVLLFLRKCFLFPVGYNIKLTANNGFYLKASIGIFMLVSFGNKTERAEHIPVISNCQGRHLILNGFIIEALYGRGSVK